MTSCVFEDRYHRTEEAAALGALRLFDLTPCSGKNIANHAAQVPKQVSDVPPAFASCEMHDGGAGTSRMS